MGAPEPKGYPIIFMVGKPPLIRPCHTHDRLALAGWCAIVDVEDETAGSYNTSLSNLKRGVISLLWMKTLNIIYIIFKII